jgi:hypothetical integral membrane protein (TIGR02206 family)
MSYAYSTFRAFEAQHLLTLGAIGAICAIVVWKARTLGESSRKWLGRSLGFILLGYVVFHYSQQAINGDFTWKDSLPLELCNIVLFACIISTFRPNRLTNEMAYFWGLGGVLQATLTPDLGRGFPSWDFILFFWSHGATLAAIAFIIAGGGFKPAGRSIVRMMLALNVYALSVGTIDALGGWNYGYLCHKPAQASLYDVLGPWPWYLASIEVFALVLFTILYIPWRKQR